MSQKSGGFDVTLPCAERGDAPGCWYLLLLSQHPPLAPLPHGSANPGGLSSKWDLQVKKKKEEEEKKKGCPAPEARKKWLAVVGVSSQEGDVRWRKGPTDVLVNKKKEKKTMVMLRWRPPPSLLSLTRPHCVLLQSPTSRLLLRLFSDSDTAIHLITLSCQLRVCLLTATLPFILLFPPPPFLNEFPHISLCCCCWVFSTRWRHVTLSYLKKKPFWTVNTKHNNIVFEIQHFNEHCKTVFENHPHIPHFLLNIC